MCHVECALLMFLLLLFLLLAKFKNNNNNRWTEWAKQEKKRKTLISKQNSVWSITSASARAWLQTLGMNSFVWTSPSEQNHDGWMDVSNTLQIHLQYWWCQFGLIEIHFHSFNRHFANLQFVSIEYIEYLYLPDGLYLFVLSFSFSLAWMWKDEEKRATILISGVQFDGSMKPCELSFYWKWLCHWRRAHGASLSVCMSESGKFVHIY